MKKTKVLDHGYVALVDSMGRDESVVEAARMSTDKGFHSWEPYWECVGCECFWIDEQESGKCLRCGKLLTYKREAISDSSSSFVRMTTALPSSSAISSWRYKHPSSCSASGTGTGRSRTTR
jgi:hypothetical protein